MSDHNLSDKSVPEQNSDGQKFVSSSIKTAEPEIYSKAGSLKLQRLRVALKVLCTLALITVIWALLPDPSKDRSPYRDIPAQDVDIQAIAPGQSKTVLWAGRPVIIVHRAIGQPQSAEDNGEWFVAIALGTDQGCVIESTVVNGPDGTPVQEFVDTCRGSKYTRAGKAMPGQLAKKDLEIPPYSISAHTLTLGLTGSPK